MEPDWEDFVIAGYEAGIRKVVEWIVYCPKCGSYLPKNLNDTRTLKCRNCDWDGQAKLKEWVPPILKENKC